MIDHQRRVRPGAICALPCFAALALLGGCAPFAPGARAAATPTPAIRSTVAVQIGTNAPATTQSRLATTPPAVRTTSVAATSAAGTNSSNASSLAGSVRPAAVARAEMPQTTAQPYAFAAPHAAPKILAIHLSTTDITGGQTVSGSVDTTSNVASIEARISGWSMSVPRTRIGHFEMRGVIPNVAFFARGAYTLELIARNTDGVKAERDIPIRLH